MPRPGTLARCGRKNPTGPGRSVIVMVVPMAMTEDTVSAMACSEAVRGEGFLAER
ncbi:MAG: hypothetical protein ACR2N6_05240 [Miltoncostaeaceae bacterium]